MKLKRLVVASLLALCACARAAAQEEIRATYQPLEDGRVKITWSVKFPAERASAEVRTQKTGNQTSTFEVEADKIKAEYDRPLNPSQTTLTTFLDYGDDKPLSERTVFADMTVRASAGPKEAPAKSAAATLSLNAEGLRDYYAKIGKINHLIATTVPKPDAAEITQWSVLKRSDRAITLGLTASQNIRVNVLAYETADPAQATGPTIFGVKNFLLLENQTANVKVPDLREGRTYVLVVEEVANPKNPAGRQTLRKVLDRDGGQPIATLAKIRDPSVKFVGSPQPKKNEAVYVELSANDATDVFAYVEASYDNGDFVKVSDEVRVPRKGGPAPQDPTLYAAQLPAALIPGRTYRVQARAVTDRSDDVQPATAKSVEFKGLPARLFDVVTFDIGPDALKFTPAGVTEPVKTSMVIKVNDRQMQAACPEGVPAQFSCDVRIADIFSFLAVRDVRPGAPPAAPQKSTVSFEVTVKAADQSERSQTTTFAMSVSAPNLANPSARDGWQNVLKFTKDVITGDGNTRLEPNKLKSSGIAGFLGAMLRGFLIL